MFQAQQKQIIQQANQQLISIRSSELDYFMSFFSNLGLNAALGIGYIAQSISQVPGFENPTQTWWGFRFLYWTASAMTLACAAYAMITAVFVSVFAQGLALRGPLGSMVRSIEGMIEEQQVIFWSFNSVIFFLAWQQIGMYFIMMDQTSAWICGAITIVAMVSWYWYALHLYNRFSWTSAELKWKDDEKSSEKDNRAPEEDDDEVDPITRLERALNRNKTQGASGSSNLENSINSRSTNSSPVKILKEIIATKSVHGEDDDAEETDGNEGSGAQVSTEDAVTGYLSLRIPGNRSFFSGLVGRSNKESGSQWKRRYFLIRGTRVYYYENNRAYEQDPQKPLNHRPISLEGYTMIAGARQAPYYISLVPADSEDERKAWKFRCDTFSEFENWTNHFVEALKKCKSWRESETGQFVDVATVIGENVAAGDINAEESDDE